MWIEQEISGWVGFVILLSPNWILACSLIYILTVPVPNDNVCQLSWLTFFPHYKVSFQSGFNGPLQFVCYIWKHWAFKRHILGSHIRNSTNIVPLFHLLPRKLFVSLLWKRQFNELSLYFNFRKPTGISQLSIYLLFVSKEMKCLGICFENHSCSLSKTFWLSSKLKTRHWK